MDNLIEQAARLHLAMLGVAYRLVGYLGDGARIGRTYPLQ